uniref:FLYWCH-type domain-containing protein n=1 Tax=Panagrolaimus sp. ES5 TaxID=591445 RepID=A0AC34F953_9BILA
MSLEIISSSKDKPAIIDNGNFLFYFDKQIESKTIGWRMYWRCRHKTCNATLTTNENHELQKRGSPHCHAEEPLEIEKLRMLHNLKKQAVETFEPTESIIDAVCSNVPGDVLTSLPSKLALAQMIRKQRKRHTEENNIDAEAFQHFYIHKKKNAPFEATNKDKSKNIYGIPRNVQKRNSLFNSSIKVLVPRKKLKTSLQQADSDIFVDDIHGVDRHQDFDSPIENESHVFASVSADSVGEFYDDNGSSNRASSVHSIISAETDGTKSDTPMSVSADSVGEFYDDDGNLNPASSVHSIISAETDGTKSDTPMSNNFSQSPSSSSTVSTLTQTTSTTTDTKPSQIIPLPPLILNVFDETTIQYYSPSEYFLNDYCKNFVSTLTETTSPTIDTKPSQIIRHPPLILNLFDETTIQYYSPSEYFLNDYCKNFGLHFNAEEYYKNFRLKMKITQISRDSKPDNILELNDKSGFGCLSMLFTGNEKYATIIWKELNKKVFDYLNDAEKIRDAVNSSTLTDEHLEIIVEWLKCKIFVYCNGAWKKY